MQRFISQDPIGFAGGDVNLYAYVGNDPVNNTDSSGQAVDGLVDLGFIAYDIYAIATNGRKDNTELWLDLAGDAAGLAIPGLTGVGAFRRAARGADDAAAAAKCFLSFVAGTLVQTEDGARPIEEIKTGDKVLSWNAETNQTEYKAVAATFTREAEIILDVIIANGKEGETLGVTSEHPFYVKVHIARDNLSSDDDEGEWRNADQLQAGDSVRRPSGKWVAVVEIKQRTGGARVYNFEVEGNHNYYVGDIGILVHNCFNPNPKKGLSGVENALDHWKKHKSDFPDVNNAAEYAKDAKKFLDSPPPSAVTKIRPNGDKIVFDPKTDCFGVKRKGKPSTYYKPDPGKHGFPNNLDYFNAQ